MRPVILDTDIGTDVDDLLALVFLAKAPGLSLEAVTTVHGNTLLRAKLARIVCEKLGIADLPIIRGISDPLSGHEIFWPGHEGHGVAGLQNASVETTISAPQFLLNLSQRYSGELEILAIGPLTNIAETISSFPEFKSRIKRLYLMGGAYWKDFPEHNIEMDVIAAKIVFESGILITAIGLDVTLKVWWTEKHIERLKPSERLGATARKPDPRLVEILKNGGKPSARCARRTGNDPPGTVFLRNMRRRGQHGER